MDGRKEQQCSPTNNNNSNQDKRDNNQIYSNTSQDGIENSFPGSRVNVRRTRSQTTKSSEPFKSDEVNLNTVEKKNEQKKRKVRKIFTDKRTETPKYKSVISESNQFHYDNIVIPDDVVDKYTPVIITSDEESQESPESKRERTEIIAKQGRLHPSNKQYNQGPVVNPPLISPGILVGYTPAGQRYQVDLNAYRPTWFNSEYARLQFDGATVVNARRMMHELQTGNFLPDCLDVNVERKYVAQRKLASQEASEHFKKIRSVIQADVTAERLSLLDSEQCLIKLNEFAVVKLADFPDELADQIKMALSLKMTPIMFKKHPVIIETVETLARQKRHGPVSKLAQVLLQKIHALFDVPKKSSFHEFFSSELERFREKTKGMTIFDVITLTEEPTGKNQLEQAPNVEVPAADHLDIEETSSQTERLSLDGRETWPMDADRNSEVEICRLGEPEE